MGKGDYLGEFELIVLLALLRLRDNAYGMTVRREIQDRTGRDVAIGAVYATLDRLEEKGYISSSVGDATAERGGRAKKFFHIEGSGERAIAETERAFAAMKKGVRGLKPILGGA